MQLETGTGAVGTLLILLLLLAAGLLVRRFYSATIPRSRPAWRRLLTGLRAAVLLLLGILILSPLILRPGEVEVPGRVVVLLEDSASLSMADQSGGRPRWESALRVCRAVDSLLTARETGLTPLFLRGNGLSRPREFDPFGRVAPPVAVGTDLSALLSGAREAVEPGSVRGTILLSDGQESPDLEAVPIGNVQPAEGALFIGLGSEARMIDSGVLDLTYPETAFVGDDILIEITVGRRDLRARDSRIRLLKDGRTVSETKLSFAEDQGVARAELVFRPDEPGMILLEVDVAAAENEHYLDNNRATIAVDVGRESSPVLCLAAMPDWNTRFLCQAAEREPRVDLSVAHPTADGMSIASEGSPDRSGVPRDWSVWDGVVADVAALRDLRGGAAALAEAVRGGMGLLILGDDRDFGLPPEIAALLPGRPAPHPYPSESALAMPAGSAAHPVLSGVDRASGGEGLYTTPIRDFRWLDPGAGGDVLLEAVAEGPDRTRRPVLVAAGAGRGRVVWCGTSALWRAVFWQRRPSAFQPDYPIEDLLSNALVWTAVGGQHQGIRLAGGTRVYQEGVRIELEAFSADLRGETLQQDVVVGVRSERTTAGVEPLDVVLRPDPRHPGRSSASLPPLPPGRYALTIPGEPSADGAADETELVIVPSTLEGSQMRLNSARLRSLARLYGAGYVDRGADTFDRRLAAHIASLDARPARTVSTAVYRPFDGWPLLLLLVLLLAIEWSLRRRLGMI